MKFASILKTALEKNASDIILTSGAIPTIKLNGDITPIEGYAIMEEDEVTAEIFSTMSEKQQKEFKESMELDYAIELKWHSRFRVNAFYTKNGPGAVLRPIKTELPHFDDLLLPKKLLELVDKRHGLLLVTGWVGSWKSTTMASLINYITEKQKRHIITVEDPIEFVFKNNQSLVEQREVGETTKSFANGLKYALRQASDVIMIGEMRDMDTFRLALRAAETGNLVIATLHTSGTARTISRIVDMFPWDEKDYIRAQISTSLLGVVWQELIKGKDKKSRVLATELLVNNTSIANMIRRSQIHQIPGALETGAEDGMYTMDKCLEILRKKWLIT